MLRELAARLKAAGCGTPQLDARVLLQHVTGLGHSDLIALPETLLHAEGLARLEELASRRAAGEPVSRILGEREFFGRTFQITPDVLDPRPDTEILVEAALACLGGNNQPRILDIGTGSGAIIITLLAELPAAHGVATDLSSAALAVARANAGQLGVAERLCLVESSWAAGVNGPFDLIVSNPPYIAAGEIAGLQREVREHDPGLALSGGADGLDAYLALLPQAIELLGRGGHVVVEFGAGQQGGVTDIARRCGLELWRHAGEGGLVRDLSGHVRCAVLVRS